MKKQIQDYLKITVGIIIVAIAITLFLVPTNLAVGGVTGLAMVINRVMPNLSIGALMTAMNICLFILGFIVIGPQFGLKTIYASFGLSGCIWVFERFQLFSGPLTEDLFLNLVFGILIQGLGMAIIFFQNASTGGTDIVAKILNQYLHVEMGKSLLLADFFITLLACSVFGVELGLYALLGVILNAVVIDQAIGGFASKLSVSIISEENEAIARYIMEELDRGTTYYQAVGGYTKSSRPVLVTVLGKREYIKLLNYVKKLDPKAFMIVSHVHNVIGEGFTLDID